MAEEKIRTAVEELNDEMVGELIARRDALIDRRRGLEGAAAELARIDEKLAAITVALQTHGMPILGG